MTVTKISDNGAGARAAPAITFGHRHNVKEAIMRKGHKMLLAGVAAVVLAGGAGVALAKAPLHAMTVPLPDGGTARILYAGDVPPKVSFSTGPIAAGFGPDDPFAALDRMSAEMDRAFGAMLRQAEAMTPALPGPDRTFHVDLRGLPAGASSYSMVSTSVGDHVCVRSTEITSAGDGKAPKVVTKTSGDCAAQPGAAASDRAAGAHAASEVRT
jgi:hypothetical protein